MARHPRLSAVLLFFAFGATANAQTSLQALRSQVSKLIADQCNPATSPAVRDLNGKILERRRESLAQLIQKRIAQLKDYPKTAGIVLTAEDQKDLNAAVEPLQAELKSLQAPESSICSAPSPGAQPPKPANANSQAAPSPKQPPAKVPASDTPATPTPPAAAPASTQPTDAQFQWHTMFTRAVAGIDLSGASSMPTQQKIFLEFNLTAPLGFRRAKTREKIRRERNYLSALNMAMAERFGTLVPTPLSASTVTTTGKLCADANEPLGVISSDVSKPLLAAAIASVKADISPETPSESAQQRQACLDSLNAAMTERFGNVGAHRISPETLSLINEYAPTSKPSKGQAPPPRANLTSEESCKISQPELQARIDQARNDLYKSEDPTNHRFWVWLNPRISSLPQNANLALSQITPSSTAVTTLSNSSSSLNDIVQGFELLGGAELELNKPENAVPFGNARLSASIFASAGFSTPFSVTLANAQEFQVPNTLTLQQVDTIFGSPAAASAVCTPPSPKSGSQTFTCTANAVVAYVPEDRTRFYPEYYAGIRLKSYFFQTGGKNSATEFGGVCAQRMVGQICPIFPGIFDLGVGQDAAVTGGHLYRFVLRAEAFYPLPFAPALHLFFTALIHLGKAPGTSNLVPVVLNPEIPPVSLASTSPQVVLIPTPVPDRDFYRIGIGVDLIQIINELRNKSANKPSPNGR